jgi:hypothetical protein
MNTIDPRASVIGATNDAIEREYFVLHSLR